MTRRHALAALVTALGVALSPPACASDTDALRRLCGVALRHLVVAHPIRFESSSARLPGTAAALVDELANLLAECRGARLVIDGHTDDRGDAALNLALSEARAAAVADAIVERGIARERLDVNGYGGTRPLADNETRDGRRRNRRIEFRLAWEGR